MESAQTLPVNALERTGLDRPGGRPPLIVRIRARLWHRTLIRRLAEGADPCSDAELRCCAERLTSPRGRLGLAVGLERAVEAAHEPPRPLTSAVPLNRGEILEQAPRLVLLAATLRSEQPVAVHGLAQLERLLTDAESALYLAAEPLAGALDRASAGLLRP
jgi:hypothetical protein